MLLHLCCSPPLALGEGLGVGAAERQAQRTRGPKLARMDEREEFWVMTRATARLGGAAAGVALATAVIRAAAPRWHLANLSMVYLLVIQVTAILAGRAPAIVAALLSFLAVDWYFVHPVGHLSVSNPDEWLT